MLNSLVQWSIMLHSIFYADFYSKQSDTELGIFTKTNMVELSETNIECYC